MSDARTTVTEIATALGILNMPRAGISNQKMPPIGGVDQAAWDPTVEAAKGGLHHELFERAYENGLYFFRAREGLRSRNPRIIQWKGPHKSVGDEATPADLRIDHVYLVSCKYDSDVLLNSVEAFTNRECAILCFGRSQRWPKENPRHHAMGLESTLRAKVLSHLAGRLRTTNGQVERHLRRSYDPTSRNR